MPFTDIQKAALNQPLDPKHIVKPTGQFGAKGDYIEGWHAINEANRIFGFDGWSYSIDLIRDSLEHGQDSRGNPQWQAAYTCICTVRVGDVTRQDVGFGSGFAKQVGDAIEGATKEAATDALKRALRTFGNVFGLALYDKKRVNVGVAEPEIPNHILDVLAEIETQNTQAALKAIWERESATVTNPDHQSMISDAINKRISQFKKKAA